MDQNEDSVVIRQLQNDSTETKIRITKIEGLMAEQNANFKEFVGYMKGISESRKDTKGEMMPIISLVISIAVALLGTIFAIYSNRLVK